jgi:hypothetical protein
VVIKPLIQRVEDRLPYLRIWKGGLRLALNRHPDIFNYVPGSPTPTSKSFTNTCPTTSIECPLDW